jgi:hypothetical protein
MSIEYGMNPWDRFQNVLEDFLSLSNNIFLEVLPERLKGALVMPLPLMEEVEIFHA